MYDLEVVRENATSYYAWRCKEHGVVETNYWRKSEAKADLEKHIREHHTKV